jgi:hypothetical protein
VITLLQLTALAGLARYRYAKAGDERVMCGLAVFFGGAASLVFWDAW